MHSHRLRHRPASRALALCLMVAQFALFAATGLTHRHFAESASRDPAASPSRGPAAAPLSARLPAFTRFHHSDSSDCPICKAAASTVVSTAAIPSVAPLVALVGQAPSPSPLCLPRLVPGLSSARAPPTL